MFYSGRFELKTFVKGIRRPSGREIEIEYPSAFKSVIIPGGTEINTGQSDSWGEIPEFQNSLSPILKPGGGIVLVGLVGLSEDNVWVEMRLFDKDGKLIDAVGQGLTLIQTWGISRDGRFYCTSDDGFTSVGESVIATAFLAIYSTVGGTSQENDADPYTVDASGISYDLIGFAQACAIQAGL